MHSATTEEIMGDAEETRSTCVPQLTAIRRTNVASVFTNSLDSFLVRESRPKIGSGLEVEIFIKLSPSWGHQRGGDKRNEISDRNSLEQIYALILNTRLSSLLMECRSVVFSSSIR